MDWGSFWTTLLASVGGTGFLLAVVIFLGKRWVEARIEQSVTYEYARKLKDMSDEREADKRLLKELLTVLPPDGSVAFISEHEVGGFAFRRDMLRELYEFSAQWGDVAHEFLDGEIDELRRALRDAVSRYTNESGASLFSDHRKPDLLYIPPEWDEGESDDRFHVALSRLNALADEVRQVYDKLVRTARRKLKC